MIDMDHNDYRAYQPPAIVRVGAVVDVAEQLRKLGVDGSIQTAWQRLGDGKFQSDGAGTFADGTPFAEGDILDFSDPTALS